MKKFFLFMIVLSLGTSAVAQKSIKNFIGKWQAIDNGEERAGLEIVDSATIFLVYGNEKRQIVDYTIDFSKTPAPFEFTVKDGSGTMTVKSIIRLVNEDLLKWQIFEGEKQPLYYVTDRGDLIYMKRKRD